MVQVIESGPDWLAAEMPPGYTTRLLEIQRLSEDLQSMARFGRLLWASGGELADAVYETFTALRFDVARAKPGAPAIAVPLDSNRRLLLQVTASEGPIQKKDSVLTDVFQVVRESAGDADRIALVVNTDMTRRPADRQPPVDADALKLLQRLGVSVVPTHALFALWSLSLQDRDRARAWIERIYALDGSIFEVPAAAQV